MGANLERVKRVPFLFCTLLFKSIPVPFLVSAWRPSYFHLALAIIPPGKRPSTPTSRTSEQNGSPQMKSFFDWISFIQTHWL